jgi:hypothetical protein
MGNNQLYTTEVECRSHILEADFKDHFIVN